MIRVKPRLNTKSDKRPPLVPRGDGRPRCKTCSRLVPEGVHLCKEHRPKQEQEQASTE